MHPTFGESLRELAHRQEAPHPPPVARRAPTALIEVIDLEKRYDEKVALSGVSFSVDRGETLVIVGASGSGKSVLARQMVGLERPTSGHVFVDDTDITALDDAALTETMRRFGIVFQRNALFDSLTVFENVAYPLRELNQLHNSALHDRVMRRLEDLGIAQAADKLPAEISGGMAKRVAIARALVTEPEILVYDEPTAGLDPLTSRVVDTLIDHMRERFFVTSVVITHDIATALSVGDRVALLDHGALVVQVPVEHVFDCGNEAIQHFFRSSAVDPSRIVRRADRSPPSTIAAAWRAAHPR